MNPIIASLYGRKSVRAYTEQELSEEEVRTILTAAAQAPSPGNQQLYTILRITDPELKHRLSISCDNQPFIEKAKLVLVFCADCRKWYRAFQEGGCEARKPDVGDLLLAVSDANIAAQNAVVAAEALGIGSCYIGDIMENMETHRKLLGLPEYVFPAAMLVFGYPVPQQKKREKPRRADMKYIVHENRYCRLDTRRLQDMLAKGRGEEEYRQWIAAFCERKYHAGFSYEMSRSVSMYLKQYENYGDHEQVT